METRTILLVEDNPDDEALTLRALRMHNLGNNVVVVRDGAEALRFLLGSGDTAPAQELPEIMLLDLKLPKVDGLEVLRQIRANPRTRRLPVVVLTSSKEEQDIISSYELGANSYVRKPVNFSEFLEAVRQLGLYWLVIAELPPRS